MRILSSAFIYLLLPLSIGVTIVYGRSALADCDDDNVEPYSDTVWQAQGFLVNKGYSSIVPDGLLGPDTRASIRRFQKERNLAVTCELDSPTRRFMHLKTSYNRYMQIGPRDRILDYALKSPALKSGICAIDCTAWRDKYDIEDCVEEQMDRECEWTLKDANQIFCALADLSGIYERIVDVAEERCHSRACLAVALVLGIGGSAYCKVATGS